LVLASASLLAACSGHTIDVGSAAQPDGGADGTSPAPASSFTALDVQRAQQACSAPHGTADLYSDVAGLQSRLVGAWYICPGAVIAVQDDGSAVFTADGQWIKLVDDGSGGLREGQGLQETGTYHLGLGNDADPVCDTSNCRMTLQSQAGGGSEVSVGFETGPRRMLLGASDWLVPIGE
jgi:hypothetical protein